MNKLGGLPRKVALLEKFQAEQVPMLVVDSGNLFFPSSTLKDATAEEKKEAADIIARSFVSKSRAIVSLGTMDLAAGTNFLLKFQEQYQITFISANLLAPGTGKPLFNPVSLQNIAGMQVVIIGLIDHAALANADQEVLAAPWQEILPDILSKYSDADIKILLSNYPEQTNREIAEGNDEIHIIVQSGKSGRNKNPELYHNTLLCTTTGKGKYQGVLRVQWNHSGRWKPYPSSTPLQQTASDKPKEIGRPNTGSTFHNRIIPITSRLPEDQESSRLIREMKQ